MYMIRIMVTLFYDSLNFMSNEKRFNIRIRFVVSKNVYIACIYYIIEINRIKLFSF